MNRRGFVGRLLAALGVGGSLGLHSRQSDVPDLPAPAPPLVTSGYLNADFGDSNDKVTFTTAHATSSSTLWIDMRSRTVGVR